MNKENLFKALDEGTIDEITDLLYEDFESTVRVLKQLKNELTPPTADEVCKVLSEYYDEDIIYTKNKYKNGFHLKNSLYIVKFENNNIEFVNKEYFNHKYPPYLIEMLGRFYEGEDK